MTDSLLHQTHAIHNEGTKQRKSLMINSPYRRAITALKLTHKTKFEIGTKKMFLDGEGVIKPD